MIYMTHPALDSYCRVERSAMLSKRLCAELFLTITVPASALPLPSFGTSINVAIEKSVESLNKSGLLPGDGHHFPHATAEGPRAMHRRRKMEKYHDDAFLMQSN